MDWPAGKVPRACVGLSVPDACCHLYRCFLWNEASLQLEFVQHIGERAFFPISIPVSNNVSYKPCLICYWPRIISCKLCLISYNRPCLN